MSEVVEHGALVTKFKNHCQMQAVRSLNKMFTLVCQQWSLPRRIRPSLRIINDSCTNKWRIQSNGGWIFYASDISKCTIANESHHLENFQKVFQNNFGPVISEIKSQLPKNIKLLLCNPTMGFDLEACPGKSLQAEELIVETGHMYRTAHVHVSYTLDFDIWALDSNIWGPHLQHESTNSEALILEKE